MKARLASLVIVLLLAPATLVRSQPATYDVIIRGGTVYDGSGGSPETKQVATVA